MDLESSSAVFVKKFPRYQDPFCLGKRERARSLGIDEGKELLVKVFRVGPAVPCCSATQGRQVAREEQAPCSLTPEKNQFNIVTKVSDIKLTRTDTTL